MFANRLSCPNTNLFSQATTNTKTLNYLFLKQYYSYNLKPAETKTEELR